MPAALAFVLRLSSFVPKPLCQILYGFLGQLVASYQPGSMV
jgi:hypothetical protein